MNVELMAKVLEHVKEDSEHFDMDYFFVNNDELLVPTLMDVFLDRTKYPRCDTAACVAGWAILLSKDELNENILDKYHLGSEMHLGADLLDIDYYTAEYLFYPCEWTISARKAIDPDKQMSDEDVIIRVMERAVEEQSLEFWVDLNNGRDYES